MSSMFQAVMPSLSFTGFGNVPFLTLRQILALLIGRIVESSLMRTKRGDLVMNIPFQNPCRLTWIKTKYSRLRVLIHPQNASEFEDELLGLKPFCIALGK